MAIFPPGQTSKLTVVSMGIHISLLYKIISGLCIPHYPAHPCRRNQRNEQVFNSSSKNPSRVNNQSYAHSLNTIKQYVTMSVTHSSSLNYSALYRHKALLLNSTTEPPFCSLNDAQARLSVCASPPGIHISPVTCVREYTYHCDTGK